MLKILCIGPQWRGSNAGGLFRALSRIENIIEIIDENYFINLSSKKITSKIVDKLSRSLQIEEFNREIISRVLLFQPDLVLVFKGAFIKKNTLISLKNNQLPVVNFYPDVSFRTHGSLLSETLPLYDHIFTTKTFGIKDMESQLGIEPSRSSFVPHGFDPEIHRPLKSPNQEILKCDVSFIGGYSEKKEKLLSKLKMRLPALNLKIWGPGWTKASNTILGSCIQNKSIFGDLYALGISNSIINLGILHEKVKGASSGDQITSRTFHIPGAGGFMMHERTEEVVQYFKEDKEAVFFSDEEELCKKVSYYLEHAGERSAIAEDGMKRAWKDHRLDNRAKFIVEHLVEIKIIKNEL